jgi:hypothetical protein
MADTTPIKTTDVKKSDDAKPVAKPTPTQAEADEMKAEAFGVDPAEAKAEKKETDKAAKRAAAEQAVAQPEPSQAEIDKMLAAASGFPYKTR